MHAGHEIRGRRRRIGELYSSPSSFHLNAPSWWKGSTSTHSTFFIGATNFATASTLAGSSVSPGTSV